MTRILKILTISAFAAMAVGILLAPAASAQVKKGVLTAGKTPSTHTATKIYATQYDTAALGVTSNLFDALGRKIQCTNTSVKFTGDAAGTDTDIKIFPEYKDCFVPTATHKVSLVALVDPTDCYYTFTQPEHVANDTTWKGLVDLVCPKGNGIHIHVFNRVSEVSHTPGAITLCEITIPPQDGINNVEYHNISGTTDDITVTVTSNNIKATQKGACGHAETITGKYTSSLTLTSGVPGTPGNDDLWISTHL